MAFSGGKAYHADSDADDEYERSLITSPMPPTDDDTSSLGDSDNGSHGQTPTFDTPDQFRDIPKSVINMWSVEECAAFLKILKLDQYGRHFRENNVSGEALTALKHEELKEMGITSVGHRLTILKGVYDVKVRQDAPIEPDHYIPLSAEDDIRNKQATQDDISRIIQSFELRDQRIREAERELRRMQDEYKKLREELLPLFKMSKERNESLPSPVLAQHSQSQTGLSRKPSKNNKNLYLGNSALKNPSSPTYNNNSQQETILNPSGAVSTATTYLAQSIAGIDISTSPNIPSPGASPGMPQQTPTQQSRYNTYGNSTDSYSSNMTGSTLTDNRPSTASTYAPSTRTTRTAAPSIREAPTEDTSAPVEVFKSFRVSLDDPCYKVLPAALKKYNIQADWRQYALYIVYGDQERCLGLGEKPLILFKQLHKEGRKPMFMLRRHVAPAEGHTRSTAGDASAGDPNMGVNPQLKPFSLPGGVL